MFFLSLLQLPWQLVQEAKYENEHLRDSSKVFPEVTLLLLTRNINRNIVMEFVTATNGRIFLVAVCKTLFFKNKSFGLASLFFFPVKFKLASQ